MNMINRDYLENHSIRYDPDIVYEHCSDTILRLGSSRIYCIGWTNNPEMTLRDYEVQERNGILYLLCKVNNILVARKLCEQLMKNFGIHKNNFIDCRDKSLNKHTYTYVYVHMRKIK